MSYLDLPRLHFSGSFISDPSTINNRLANYNAAAPLAAGWNSMGKHWFFLDSCTIKRVVDASGTVMTTAADDPEIGKPVETTNIPAIAKLVDLDPEHQTSSQIWGAKFKLGSAIEGELETATLRDLWFGRAGGGMQGAGGVFQSVLEKVVFMGGASGPSSSAIVGGLRATSTGGKLSIKFVLYAYEPSSASANFTHGKIVGTVGPHLSGDELHFLAARRLESRGAHAFGSAPFKIDTSRNKVIIDLGNAIPESVPGGARKSHGTLTARIITGGSTTNLGTLDYSQAHYEQTAGVEEVSITAAEATQLASNPLGLHRTNPSNQLVMGEHPNGSYLDVTLSALRLNPGFSPAVELVATEFGAPKSGQSIGLARIKGIPSAD